MRCPHCRAPLVSAELRTIIRKVPDAEPAAAPIRVARHTICNGILYVGLLEAWCEPLKQLLNAEGSMDVKSETLKDEKCKHGRKDSSAA